MEIKKVCKCFFEKVSLSSLTTFRIGGQADYVCYPTRDELISLTQLCTKLGLDYFILGNGSNILALDEGYRGVIISTKGLDKIFHTQNLVRIESGVALGRLCAFCLVHGLSGLEPLCGIPGTVGGAVVMNAGAFGLEFGDLVESVEYLENGVITNLKKSQLLFEYRKSFFTNRQNCVILSVVIKLHNSTYHEIYQKMKEYAQMRMASQNVGYPSAGSVFKKCGSVPTAYLIEACGLKGKMVGGAAVSNVHAGFIVNTGGATSFDVISLMNLIKCEVSQKFCLDLEPELVILGG